MCSVRTVSCPVTWVFILCAALVSVKSFGSQSSGWVSRAISVESETRHFVSLILAPLSRLSPHASDWAIGEHRHLFLMVPEAWKSDITVLLRGMELRRPREEGRAKEQGKQGRRVTGPCLRSPRMEAQPTHSMGSHCPSTLGSHLNTGERPSDMSSGGPVHTTAPQAYPACSTLPPYLC